MEFQKKHTEKQASLLISEASPQEMKELSDAMMIGSNTSNPFIHREILLKFLETTSIYTYEEKSKMRLILNKLDSYR